MKLPFYSPRLIQATSKITTKAKPVTPPQIVNISFQEAPARIYPILKIPNIIKKDIIILPFEDLKN